MLGDNQKLTIANKLVILLFLTLIISLIAAIAERKPTPVKKVTAQQPSTQIAQVIGSDDEDVTAQQESSDEQVVNNSNNPDILFENAEAECHINGDLPDPVCTPGVIDPNVTQANITQTICVAGYTKKVRPPLSVTTPMKITSMRQYGFSGSTKDYEYDHLISLELGGAPLDTANLWPEPGPIPNPKDSIANALHKLVCNGSMQLAEAQHRISTDWTTALNGY